MLRQPTLPLGHIQFEQVYPKDYKISSTIVTIKTKKNQSVA